MACALKYYDIPNNDPDLHSYNQPKYYHQGFVKGEELSLNPYLVAGCRSFLWLAVEVLSPCRK